MKEFMYEIKDDLCRMLENCHKDGNISRADLQDIHMMTDTIKNICKIEKLEQGEGASYGDWRAMGSYGRDGYSEGNRGTHYVRGHYSYDDGRMMPDRDMMRRQ